VTLAFVRSPTLVAYTAWDLSILSGGRFELGLGTQIKQNIQDRFGMPWTEPRSGLRDYVGALDALFGAFRTKGSLRHEGEHYRLTRMQRYFNPGPSDAVIPPIWLGAVSAGMCELAGEVAHPVVTHSTNSDPAYLRDVVRPALRRSAASTGRTSLPLIMASAAIATGRQRRRGRARARTAAPHARVPVLHALVRNGLAAARLDRPARAPPRVGEGAAVERPTLSAQRRGA